jgi:hypothetical protein
MANDIHRKAQELHKSSPNIPHTFLLPADIADDKLESKIFKGVIVDSIHYAHHYWVSLDKGGTIPATELPSTSLDHFAYRTHTMYTPGTRVLCYRDPLGHKAWIIGTIPHEITTNEQHFADWILPFSRCGWRDEWHHHYQSLLKEGGFIGNFTNNRPADTFPGEWGVSNSLGLGINLGLTSAMLRVSELAGLYMFYLDNKVRLSAYNYQLWTGTREEESLNDEGENNDIVRISPFPWEMLGAVRHGDDSVSRGPSTEEWTSGRDTSYYEPAQDDQTGIFRFHQFRGYLGDGERSIISCPPPDLVTPETLTKPTKHIGLSEIVRMSNGLTGIRSVKGIFLEKTCQIVVPKQLRLSDDSEGDSQDNENYKAAGELGEGPDHNKAEFEWGEDKPSFRSAQLFDMHSWMFNTYSWVSFGRHENDWQIWEESSPPSGVPDRHEDPALFTGLGKKFQTGLPNAQTLKIDNRPGHEHKIYQSRSMISMLDDGSVIIEDGYGSQIVMSGGNIFTTCQGDVNLMPGRNVVVWAPHDFIARAGNCADITAAKKDVRIKAEKNLHMLAGNAGTGGIMLESRGEGFDNDYSELGVDTKSTGIALVAKKSQVLQYGERLYMRSTGEGSIFLDADKGKGYIWNFAKGIYSTVKDGNMILHGVRPDEDFNSAKIFYTDSSNVIATQGGSFITDAAFIAGPKASIYVNGYVLGSTLIQNTNSPTVIPKWGPRTASDLEKVHTDMVNLENRAPSNIQNIRQQIYKDKTQAGNDTFVKSLGFSCRTDAQYGIEDFVIFESRWQQLYDKHCTTLTYWDEPIVKSPNNKLTRPHPGHETWTGEKYGKNQHKYWSPDGYNEERDFDEDAPEGDAPQMERLDQNYIITLQE